MIYTVSQSYLITEPFEGIHKHSGNTFYETHQLRSIWEEEKVVEGSRLGAHISVGITGWGRRRGLRHSVQFTYASAITGFCCLKGNNILLIPIVTPEHGNIVGRYLQSLSVIKGDKLPSVAGRSCIHQIHIYLIYELHSRSPIT